MAELDQWIEAIKGEEDSLGVARCYGHFIKLGFRNAEEIAGMGELAMRTSAALLVPQVDGSRAEIMPELVAPFSQIGNFFPCRVRAFSIEWA
ncbi:MULTISPECIES: hypothetical protein [Sphingobium]|uniref:Uncharacterized protein n=3 Tax=Sphingobium TaxID=165695 RepID=T0H3D6_9SPHN|nr:MULTISPECIES: hypothetical protein [Sphingobium]EQB10861.1 hypothetical protein RLDS_25835 [Sphingobium lactosutens DS20]QDC36510.1 hypothetical protein FIL70_03875 [Sphingobium fuliginis ATCC 27551]QNG43995.1 hypothetical protein H3V42_19070 [Sphingobium yanoikuyae]